MIKVKFLPEKSKTYCTYKFCLPLCLPKTCKYLLGEIPDKFRMLSGVHFDHQILSRDFCRIKPKYSSIPFHFSRHPKASLLRQRIPIQYWPEGLRKFNKCGFVRGIRYGIFFHINKGDIILVRPQNCDSTEIGIREINFNKLARVSFRLEVPIWNPKIWFPWNPGYDQNFLRRPLSPKNVVLNQAPESNKLD